MADAAVGIRGHGDRVHHGVSFEQWAFVLAGLGDGLALEELLAHLRLDEASWEPASAAFQEDVLDDVEVGGGLIEVLDEAMRAARRSWTRPIPPLDVDLRAWLDFYRAWAAAESPMEFLEARGLRATDIHRLQDHWSGKLAEDDARRAEAGAILQAPPGPVPRPKPEAPRLGVATAPTEAQDVTGPAARHAQTPLPFTDGELAPAHPRLSVPLPLSTKLAGRLGADRTRVATPAETEGLVLPFLAPEPMAPEPQPIPSAPEPRHDDGERILLSIERYAALCVDLIEAPDTHEPTLRRYGITAAEKLALDVHWTQKMAEDTTTWLAWERACAERRAEGGGEGEDGGNMEAQHERVLVIDDDELLGTLVRRALAPEHDVVVLTSAREALARVANGERWDLILCDLMLPQVTGMDFYDRVGELAPDLVARIVFIPGGAYTPRAAAFLAQPSIARLEKPFSLAELRRVVQERLSPS